MNKRVLGVLRWVGYGVFFVVALVLFMRFTFPTDQVRELAKAKLMESLGAERVEIADLGILGLLPSGVSLEGVVIDMPPIKVKTPERGVDVPGMTRSLSIEELDVSGSLLGLAGGSYDVEVDGKIQGGALNGGKLLWEKGGPLSVEITDMKGIELGSESLFQTLTGFDVLATLGGHLKLEVPATDKDGKAVLQLGEVSGEVALELSDARIVQPIFDTVMQREQVRMSFTDTSLGTVTLKLSAEGAAAPTAVGADASKAPRRRSDATVINLEEISAAGGDIEIAVAPKATITIQSGQTLKEAIINLHLAIRVNEGWFDIEVKDPKDPTKMTKPNVGVRTMLTMGPLKAYVQDGQFGVGITGPLGKPKVSLERPRTRVGAGTARKMNVDQPGGDAGDEEGEDELDGRSKSTRPPPPPPESSRARPQPQPRNNAPDARPIVRPSVGGRGMPSGLPPGANDKLRPRPRIVTEPEPAVEPAEPTQPDAPEPNGEELPNGEAPAPEGEAPADGEPLPEPNGEEPLSPEELLHD